MKLINQQKRLLEKISPALPYLCLTLLGVFILSYIPFLDIEYSYNILSLLFGAVCGYSLVENKALGLISMLLININGDMGILLLMAFALLIRYIDKSYNKYITIFSVLLLLVILTASQKWLDAFLSYMASFTQDKSIFFGSFNEVLTLFLGTKYQSLFYHTDIAGAVLNNEGILTGAVDIFSQTRDNPPLLTSKYLTGKYLANIFVSSGVFVFLYPRLKSNHSLLLILSIILSVLAGDNTLISLIVLLYNPLIYLGYVGIIGIGYLVVRIIDIRIGFINSASLIELICYIQKPLYFILVGFVLAVMMYFLSLIIIKRNW